VDDDYSTAGVSSASHLPYWLLFVAFVLFLLWRVTRAREQFVLSIRHGELLVIRGCVPGGLLHEFRDVVATVARGEITATRGPQGRVTTVGLNPQVAQRVRNVFGLCKKAALRSAPPLSNPNWGQRLGHTALAWWCHNRQSAH
jgi:hypothetical protein